MQRFKQVRCALVKRDPAAIRRPGNIFVAVHRAAVDFLILAGGKIEEVEPPVFIEMHQPLAIRRRKRPLAKHHRGFGELCSGACPVCREAPQFDLAALVGERIHRFAVVRKDAFTRTKIGGAGHFNTPAVAHWGHEYLSARGDRDAIPVRRRRNRTHKFPRIFYPTRADVFEIRLQAEHKFGISVIRGVQQINIGAALVGDALAVIGNRGTANIKLAMARVLLQIAAFNIHRPDIHGAIAIRNKIDAAISA